MNNIQKAFKNKAKCGLRMAAGGIIDSSLVDQQAIKAGTVDPNGSDFDTINAERTLRWANDDAATAKKYHTAFDPTMAATDLAKGLLSQPQPAQTTQGVQPVQPAAPMDTTFAQDMNARDQRIRGYGKGLGRNYADGGVIQETPDQLMARMAAKYGVGGGKPAPVQAPVAAPQPVQQPVVQPSPAPLGLRGIATGGLDRRMAAAGMAEGGIVHGKGGPTDDAVPMNVGGVDVNLSNKEAVLPAKSVAALGGPEAVEELIEHTNGKPPVKSGLRAGGEYATGVIGDTLLPSELRPEFRSQAQVPVIDPAANAGLETMRNSRAAKVIGALPDAGPYAPAPVAPPQAPVATPQAPAQGRFHQAGKQFGATVNNARAGLRGTAVPLAGAALSARAELLDKDQSDLFNDPSVPTTDKLRQMGRVTLRNAGALGAGTVAGVAGTVAGGPLLGVPAGIAGGAAGYVGGNKLGEAIFGDPIADRKARGANAQRDVHNAIMAGQHSGSFDLPKIGKVNTFDEKLGRFQFGDDDPNVMGLRAAGVTGGLTGDVTDGGRAGSGPQHMIIGANGQKTYVGGEAQLPKTAATGIRTIDGANGQKIYAGRDAKGQLNVSSGAGMSAADADAARDAAFAKAGTKKDAYGNWMADQRNGDKAALAQMQQERTLRDAFNPDIADPNVQSNARARLGYDLAGQQIAAKGGLEQARLILDKARFDREGKQQDREQANKDREFASGADKTRLTQENDELDVAAGGDKEKRAVLHRFASGYKDDPKLNGAQNAQAKASYAEARQWLNERGQHLLSREQEDDGRSVPDWRKDSHTFWDYARGLIGDDVYEDRHTGQRIDSRTLANAPESVRRAFKDHIDMYAQSKANKSK